MIEARGLTKRFGDKLAVDQLTFTVEPGRITGFLGPNGAGKTTTMRLILGLDRPTGGTVTVHGKEFSQLAYPMHEVGALLDAKAVHGGRSAYNHLLCLAQSNNLPRRRVDEVLGLVGLAAEGRTVFVSSHLMSEMENTADHLLVIGRGRLIADCSVAEFIERNSVQSVRVRTPQPDVLVKVVLENGGITSPGADGAVLVQGVPANQIGDLAFEHGIRLHELAPTQASLEEAFMELTADSVEFHARTPGEPGTGLAASDRTQKTGVA